ncbi:MAG: carboxypeptidase-like regulatory domain-containing protein [Candidatus Eremiobacteraeota bacterium]|nr:carboxypeptidase-like regulatory domain-containing protein [Candidatus Eremiobacteraeota bacterium]
MMALRRSVFIVLGAALLAGCGQGIPPAGNYATLSGRVTDATTGAAVAGALVSVNGSALTATTDDQGAFTVAPVPTGDWDYTVSAKGYKSLPLVTNPAPLGPGEKRSVTIKLAHG